MQERGLYFFDDAGRDPQIKDLIEFDGAVPVQPRDQARRAGRSRGRQGRWIYVGLGLWRQLPAGTDGAYRLMANLLSLR